MSQTVQTQFGTGTVVDHEVIRGRVSYKVEGPGFSTWIEAAAMPLDFQVMPHPDDVQDNSVTLPYNPSPQSWVNPADQNIVPGEQAINPDKRTAPADSVDFQADGESYEPGPDPRLFATGGLSPEDIQAKLGPKYVNAFVEHDFTSLQARIDENPELVMAEYRERVAELVAQADQEHLERVGLNERLEASDHHIREAAWKDVRAKAVRLRHSGQVMTHAANPDVIATQVTGDHGTYEVMVIRSNIFQGSSAVDSWTCECPWGQWAFQRSDKFMGRLCSHAYASLLELQSMTRSKTHNPRFRNSPGIGFDPSTLRNRRRRSSVDQYEVGDKAFAHGIGATYVIEKDGAGYLVRDMYGGDYFVDDSDLSPMDPDDDDHEYWGHLSSRTAETVDIRPVGWDPYSRSLMNQLRDLWEEGSRPGREKERNEEIRELVQELRDRGFATDGIMAARESFLSRPMGYGDIPYYGTSEDYILEHELQYREDVTDPEFVYPAGGDHGVVQDINDGGGERTAALSLPKGTQVQRLNLDGSPSGQTGVVSRDHQGLTEWDQVAVLWDGDDKPSLNDLTEVHWGEYEDGTPTKKLDDPWNIHGGRNLTAGSADHNTFIDALEQNGWAVTEHNDATDFHPVFSISGRMGNQYIVKGLFSKKTTQGRFIEGSIATQDHAGFPKERIAHTTDMNEALGWLNQYKTSAIDDYAYGEPPAYDSGDEFGGYEDPFYVDPVEREDWPEDDIVARVAATEFTWTQDGEYWKAEARDSKGNICELNVKDYGWGAGWNLWMPSWGEGVEGDYAADSVEDAILMAEHAAKKYKFKMQASSEDDIVANFQRNAGWIMGGNSEGSGGNDDIAAAAAAHLRTAGRNFTMAEQQALIDEDDGQPYDRSQLRLDGTHYL